MYVQKSLIENKMSVYKGISCICKNPKGCTCEKIYT